MPQTEQFARNVPRRYNSGFLPCRGCNELGAVGLRAKTPRQNGSSTWCAVFRRRQPGVAGIRAAGEPQQQRGAAIQIIQTHSDNSPRSSCMSCTLTGGSQGWQAYEQLVSRSGGAARQSRAVDVFSYGLLLHYCLTGGRHPFGARYERDMNILQARSAANVGSLARLQSCLPVAWALKASRSAVAQLIAQ